MRGRKLLRVFCVPGNFANFRNAKNSAGLQWQEEDLTMERPSYFFMYLRYKICKI